MKDGSTSDVRLNYMQVLTHKKNNYIHLSTLWVSKHQTITKQTKTNKRTYPDKTNIKMNDFNNSPTDI